MNNHTTRNRTGLAIAAATIVALSFSSASAWGHFGGHFGRFHGGYYHHGFYGWPYGGPWFIGSYVPYLPDGYTIYTVGNDSYYYYGGYYFLPSSSGYVVTEPPAQVIAAPAAPAQTVQQPLATTSGTAVQSVAKSASSDTVTIGVPNSKGGFTSVKLIKRKDGYVGPQGEFYAGHATIDQLKALYGN
jgi:hypothetical protein